MPRCGSRARLRAFGRGSSTLRPMRITGVIPQLRTTNLASSIDFYVSRLGATLAFEHEDFYAGIRLGNQVVHLKLVDEEDPSVAFVRVGEHFDLYLETEDVAAAAEQ